MVKFINFFRFFKMPLIEILFYSSKLIVNALTGISFWFGLKVLIIYVHIHKLQIVFLFFHRLLIQFKIYFFHNLLF